MERTNVLVIGGGPAGTTAAVTGKNFYPDKDFLLIRKEKEALIPCGIPYILGTLKSSDKDLRPNAVLESKGVRLKVGEVVSINPKNKVCKTADGEEISFEKLVLATGSIPVVPGWLKGAELENVFTIPKDRVYLDQVVDRLQDTRKVVVIGGGFIGVEVSDELNKSGKEVTIVEILPHILGLVFDDEVAVKVEESLLSRGVNLKVGVGVKEIIGKEKVTGVILQNGEKLEADAVILSLGYRPNVELAKKSGIKINEMGFIKVDEYMRTDNPHIFAVGDCAEKRDFITGKLSGIMLASTACAMARIAGMNLYKLSAVRTFCGTIGIFFTVIGETGFGTAGLIETVAKKEGFDVVTGTFEGVDKHPGTLPGTHKQIVKLIVARESGVILGGEVIGGRSVGELTNLIGFVIQNKMTVTSILTSQIGTHPLLTSSPGGYPLIKAAEIAMKKIKMI